MRALDIIRGGDIEAGLQRTGRVYLCGNLSGENALKHIPTTGYEIGISVYPEYTFEKAHVHTYNREYNYVVEGRLKVFLLREGREYLVEKGDLFVINTDEPYVSKADAGTKTIFSKVPGGNDKVLVPMSPALMRWGSSWDAVYEEG